jgi:phosphatidylethanolamine/phosphatidyl-N-methylethanolamine N-methyltransferase
MSQNGNSGHFGTWLRAWAKDPLKLGAIAPSSAELARAMARLVPLDRQGPVIELGGGTGVVTAALLAAGIAEEALVVVERDPTLHRLLARRFPSVHLLAGDATDLARLIQPLGLGPARAVVSSLPLLTMSRETQRRIVEAALAAMAPGAPLVQFTYGLFSPIDRRALGLEGEVASLVLANLPPARVWRYRRGDAAVG